MVSALNFLLAAVFSIGELSSASNGIRNVTIEGDVVEVFRDDIDPDFGYLLLMDNATVLPAVFELPGGATLDSFVDSRIRVTGNYSLSPAGLRIFTGPFFDAGSMSNITVVGSVPDVFSVPELNAVRFGREPKDLTCLGRRRATGRVTAVWDFNQVLIKTTNDVPIRVILRRNSPVPPAGAVVTVVGRVTSDLFHYVLDLATYRTEKQSEKSPSAPTDVSIRQFYGEISGAPGIHAFDAAYDSRLVRLRGHVRSVPVKEAGLHRLILEEDGFEAAVDVSVLPNAARDLCIGCIAEATGVCVIDSPLWNPTRLSPRVNGFIIAPRTADDIVLVRRPPWWTPLKFAIVIGILLALLLLALAWSGSLRILIERRGRQLARRQAETIHARLKTAERTRLATELHDSVVQNLTGAALGVRAARTALPEGAADAEKHLDIVQRTIDSSRTELRNCIWDLRNHALEQKSVDEAIRITLQPHLDGASLRLRFNVPRQTIPDSDFHAILCIVRELVINAVRHGGATLVRIAGSRENGRVLFSVSDNGCGFDIAGKPGMEQGHFGLEGISERAKALGGTLSLQSTLGKGTRACVNIAVSTDN